MQIHRLRADYGFQGTVGGEKREWLLTRYAVLFWGDKNILELDSGNGCTILSRH
jgi:hypothetical protein